MTHDQSWYKIKDDLIAEARRYEKGKLYHLIRNNTGEYASHILEFYRNKGLYFDGSLEEDVWFVNKYVIRSGSDVGDDIISILSWPFKELATMIRGDEPESEIKSKNSEMKQLTWVILGALFIFVIWDINRRQGGAPNRSQGTAPKEPHQADKRKPESSRAANTPLILCMVVPVRKYQPVRELQTLSSMVFSDLFDAASNWRLTTPNNIEDVERPLKLREGIEGELEDGQDVYYQVSIGNQPESLLTSKMKYQLKDQVRRSKNEVKLTRVCVLESREGLGGFIYV